MEIFKDVKHGLMLRMHKRKKRRRPLKRYVYLMERKTNRTWKTIFTGKREIKIGVSKNTQQRHQTVDNGIPGRVVILEEYIVNRASTVEAELHRKYKSDNFTVKNAKRGAGSTEFFRLTDSEIREIKRFLRKKSGQQNEGNVFLWIFILSIIAVLIVHYFNPQ